jgi:hypothetical protein
MLESCARVEQAIAFREFQDTTFSYAKIQLADRTGASVIIKIHNGKLYFDRYNQSRGFGYREKAPKEGLRKVLTANLQSGLPILQACKQECHYATKYSTLYNLL